jgi:poly(hydroxyalkanoate) depolymerase family esterase
MLNQFQTRMREATQLTRAGRLMDATALLQRLLSNRPDRARPALSRDDFIVIDGQAEPHDAPAPQADAGKQARPSPPRGADQGQFLSRSFANEAGSREYRLYIPAGYHGQPVPLIVMLHGCTQSPDDFAAGTRMNIAAETHTCLIAYPAQSNAANLRKCWNWFRPADQLRDAGEPSLIAGITRQIMRDYAIDPARIFIAGLSAGGAAAVVMGQAYPELYAAVGVHSGLACGAAHDMPSAFAAMQGGKPGQAAAGGRMVPTIIFHGDRDTTVHPRNAGAVAAQAAPGARERVVESAAPDGRRISRTLFTDAKGRAIAEQWLVHGGGHAWFGGSPDGSYTDPGGPDATAAMMRFFLAQARRA